MVAGREADIAKGLLAEPLQFQVIHRILAQGLLRISEQGAGDLLIQKILLRRNDRQELLLQQATIGPDILTPTRTVLFKQAIRILRPSRF